MVLMFCSLKESLTPRINKLFAIQIHITLTYRSQLYTRFQPYDVIVL